MSISTVIVNDRRGTIVDRCLRDKPDRPRLDWAEHCQERRKDVAYFLQHRVRRGGKLQSSLRKPQQGPTHFATFFLVAVQQRVTRTPGNSGNLPGKVRSILHTRVHALAANRRVDMTS